MPHDRATADAQLEAALELLRANHQRVTEPRKAILGILTREHGPFTAEELHKRMRKGSCDLVTVYRSLAAMEESTVVRRCDFGDGAYRYEITTTISCAGTVMRPGRWTFAWPTGWNAWRVRWAMRK
jgi:Fur family ferric uptake transcriptional regulator